jgi:hypothetical protein
VNQNIFAKGTGQPKSADGIMVAWDAMIGAPVN